jgi:signal transduction histidine kinase/putative methionine-R-sulfoxide reductase with GAF domain
VARDVTERRLASDELGALRRVAIVAAEGAPPSDLFTVVAEEVARVVDVPVVTVVRYEPDAKATVCSTFPTDLAPLPAGTRFSLDGTTLSSLVRDRCAAVRVDDYSQLDGGTAAAVRDSGVRAAVGVPIVVAGSLWGSMAVWSMVPEPLPDDTADRLAHFTELLATAIANAESREALARLAEQQAALRRVATLVATGVNQSELFAAVAEEMARCLGTTDADVVRFEQDGAAVVVIGSYSPPGVRGLTVGERVTLDGDGVSARVLRTGRPARMDSYEDADGTIAALARKLGIRSRVGAPIVVDGHVWGVALAGTSDPEPLPPDTEARIAEFADLVATAIAASTARDDLGVLAEQQAALRRVATLVARGASPSDVFEAVADEMARWLRVMHATVSRYEGETFIPLAIYHGDRLWKVPEGLRWPLEGDNVLARVFRSGGTARMDSHDDAPGLQAARLRELGIRSAVGAPIIVGGRVWGAAIVASSASEPLPPDTEARIRDFADLVATAIANAAARTELRASRDELRVLAEQQAALRRVATLVARGASPSDVFSIVVDEMARCLNAGNAGLGRFEGDEVVVLATSQFDPDMKGVPVVGERIALEGDNFVARVFRTGAPARVDSTASQNAPGTIAERVRGLGLGCTVAVPIVVDGRVWGTATVGAAQSLPPDTEARIGDFADLVATAIANAATRAELIASRARIVAAADDARRRLERDLHDGAQQRLVALGLGLRAAEGCVPDELRPLREQIAGLVTTATEVSAEVQEISRGIHPAILSRGGLGPALKTLARRSAVPVDLDLRVDRRFADSVEVGAYYVVAEALTNAAKHARASVVEVGAHATSTTLRLEIRDDGIGGAATGKGSGLTGLVDRVEALGGRMTVHSPVGSGTSLLVDIPLDT